MGELPGEHCRRVFIGLAIGERIAIPEVVIKKITAQGTLSPQTFPLFPTLLTSQVL